jgi:DNA polymerase-3 subunit alpha
MLSALKFSHTKAPRAGSTHTKYAMFDLEDLDGMVRCIIWPEQFALYGHLVKPDAILVVRGKVDRRPGSEETNFIIDELISLEDLESRYTSGVMIRVMEDVHGRQGLEQLHEILRGYPGDKSLRVLLSLADGARVQLDSPTMRVELSPEMRGRVDDLLGPGNFRLVVQQPKLQSANDRGRAMAGR